LTAAVLGRARAGRTGLRPMDGRRDLAPVARLIEEVFAGRLDAHGRRMLREMRLVGSAGWMSWLLGWIFLPAMTPPLGFVWEDSGRLVGNASLLRVEGFPERWVVANVAVRADVRRRGIARRLVQACLDLARQQRAQRVLLQVDTDNVGAQALYLSQGFRVLTTRTTWSRPAGRRATVAELPSPARSRRREEWQAQWELARRLHPEGLLWPLPPQAEFFRPAALSDRLGGRGPWVWPEAGPLMASLSARLAVERSGWRLFLVADPAVRGQAERALLAAAVAAAQTRRAALLLDYPPGPADADLTDLGFRAERTLTWMGLELRG